LWKFGSGKLSLGVHCSNSKVSVFTAVEIFREKYEDGFMAWYVRLAVRVKPGVALGHRQRKCKGGKGVSSSVKGVNHSTKSAVNILYCAVR